MSVESQGEVQPSENNLSSGNTSGKEEEREREGRGTRLGCSQWVHGSFVLDWM